jgi:hypothetical protein
MLIDKDKYFCPICNKWYELSDYLKTTFADDEKTMWTANMVTHYRHVHITSWNKCWGHNGSAYRYGWFKKNDYDEKKKEVNERAKRQIMRKCNLFLIEHGITKVEFIKLCSDPETLNLAYKLLENTIQFTKDKS